MKRDTTAEQRIQAARAELDAAFREAMENGDFVWLDLGGIDNFGNPRRKKIYTSKRIKAAQRELAAAQEVDMDKFLEFLDDMSARYGE